MQDFEKLGLFYLGRSYDLAARKAGDNLVLYDSRDLVTHAVCVGMTGSGKTGLCLSLLEEAAIDHVPAIAIDPKGDIANLLLTFPQLRGEDFAPWVDPGEARKQGITPEAFAAAQAETWKTGLAEWGQDGDRIQRLRDSAEFRVYTPGSQAGLPISILSSFDVPPDAVLEDPEAFAERVGTTADSLLGLLGIEGDASQSREHLLLSNILAHAWKAGEHLDLAALIPRVQNPPFARVGVMELESFYPSKDRFALALKLNNLLASPGFETWLMGEPLDIDRLLHSPEGKPRISIISVAHLGESERMFFVALLLNQVLGWVRSQAGTSSLRAILYMDEIYGYFPPVAAPPSKKPLLTLLKQARAYGLGVVLATQNPADLDYKGLSNTGTWFIGRLQAERDKLRVLDGLEGASAAQSAAFDRKQMDKILSGLGKRMFLLHNVHEDQPEVFQVRWALSYLRGPLTRQQIKQLMDPVKAAEAADDPPPAPKATAPAAVAADPAAAEPAAPAKTSRRAPAKASGEAELSDHAPILPPDVPSYFLPLRGKTPAGSTLVFRPMVLGCGEVYYQDAKKGVSETVAAARLAALTADTIALDWAEAESVEITLEELEKEPPAPGLYDPLPSSATKWKSYATWTKGFVDALYRTESLDMLQSKALGVSSEPGESERDFRIRLQQSAKEARDAQLDKLRAKYAPKLAALDEKIRKAELVVAKERDQARDSGLASLVKVGTTVLNAVLGRKTLSASTVNKAGSAVRDVGKTMKQSGDVSRAQETAESLRQQAFDLESEFRAESRKVQETIDPLNEPLDTVALKPKKTNITAKLVALVWAPHWRAEDGGTSSAWG
ncbi:MAG: hypothetical protein U0835_24710 [Isosphaeraceae bacterium]